MRVLLFFMIMTLSGFTSFPKIVGELELQQVSGLKPKAKQDWPVYGTLLSTEEIRMSVSGKTLNGCYKDGLTWQLTYNPDGTFGSGSGGWYAKNSKLCYRTFSSTDIDLLGDSCQFVSRDDKGLHFYASRGDKKFGSYEKDGDYVSSTVCPMFEP